MKAFYFHFGLSVKDTVSGITMNQNDNDNEFLECLLYNYNLHPSNPKQIRRLHEATDFLKFQLNSWDGDRLEWLLHTFHLVISSYNELKTDKEFLQSDFFEIERIIEWLNTKRQKETELSGPENNFSVIEKENSQNQDSTLNGRLLNIPTRATADQILNFWLKLNCKNRKGEPYWKSKQEIRHFVYQNFDTFPGVGEIKLFNPNMNKPELNYVTWSFYRKYGMSKTKKLYEKLLMLNFAQFKDDKVYCNTKDQSTGYLKSQMRYW